MGIVDWFRNDLNNDERVLTRDLLSVAIADKEFSSEEKKMILDICQIEDISDVELINSIRNPENGANKLHTLEKKKNYLMHLIRLMSVDNSYSSMEMHIIEIIAKEIGVSPWQLISFVLDEYEAKSISEVQSFDIIDHFVKYFITTGV